MSRPSIVSEGNARDDTVSGVNVTPLVDIALVLLIIFMVTAGFAVSPAIPLNFPRESPGQQIQLLFGVELRANGDILVDNDRLSNDEQVLSIAREAHAKHRELRAVIRADPAVRHGRVIRVLDLVQQAGITSITFGIAAATPAPAAAPHAAPERVKP